MALKCKCPFKLICVAFNAVLKNLIHSLLFSFANACSESKFGLKFTSIYSFMLAESVVGARAPMLSIVVVQSSLDVSGPTCLQFLFSYVL